MIINYSDYKKIQEMKAKGYNANQTYQKLGFTLYVTYKLWNMTEEEFLKEHNLKHDKLDKYKDFILEELRTYPDIHNTTILDHIKEKFEITKFDFSLAAYFRYMKALRKEYGFKVNDYRKYRMEANSKPGEEAQVDMGEYKIKDLEGNIHKIYFFVMVLCYSREKYVYFSSEKFNCRRFIYAHDNAFRFFGGRPKLIYYDQDKTNVIAENVGSIVLVKEFNKYVKEVGFEIYLCKGHDPDTKGKVENVVKFVKTSFLDSRIYYGIDNLNLECMNWLDRTGNGTMSLATFKIPREVFIKEEAKYLTSYDHERISLTTQRIVRVNDLSDIEYKCNFYALPLGKYDKDSRVRIEEAEDNLLIFDIDTGELIVTHKLLLGKGERATIDIPKKIPKIFYDMKKQYKRSKGVSRFLNNMASTYPRYITQQCRLLKKAFKTYEKEDVLFAIRKCNEKDLASVADVLSILVVKYGLAKAKPILPVRSSGYYQDQASILIKYDMLKEDRDE